MRILLLGGGLQGLSCGESLSKNGHIIDVVSNELHIKRSRFFNIVYSKGFDCTSNSVLSILANVKYDVIIPMGDKSVSCLSKNKEIIERRFGCKCATPKEDLLNIVCNKSCFMLYCKQYCIPHPITFKIENDNLEGASLVVGFPSLIKPNYSVGARGITRVNNIDDLKKYYPIIKKRYGECSLQALIENSNYYYNVMLYRNKDGKFLAYTIIKIVRMYPVGAGSSTCCISEENDELLDICKKCLDRLDWVGMADFDVLQGLDDKEYKIIEINPRVPASLRAAQISGVNFPEIIASDAVGGEVPSYQYQPGKVLRFLGTDLMWFAKSKNRWKSNPCWFKFFDKNLYYQDIYANDLSTYWTWLAEGLLKFKKNTIVR